MDPVRLGATARAHPTPVDRLDHDPATPRGQVIGIDHLIARKIENHARSGARSTARWQGRTLGHGSCPSVLDALNTPIISKDTSRLALRHDHAQLRRARLLDSKMDPIQMSKKKYCNLCDLPWKWCEHGFIHRES